MNWLKNCFFIIGYYLKRAHWLSMDVVAGAMTTHVVASRLPDGHGKVSWASTTLIGISVFSIYAIDRLLDNSKDTSSATPTPRHRFHAKHQALLLKLICILVLLGIVCLFWLPPKMLLIGFALVFMVGLYLFFIFKTSSINASQALKEPLVTIIYTVGIWGTAIFNAPHIPWENSLLMMLFGLLAFQNLLLFSWFESFDLEQGYSLAIAWGTETISKVLNWLSSIIVMAAVCIIVFTSYRYCVRLAMVTATMSVCMYILKQQWATTLINERYRWLGDGILLLTIWLL